MSISFDNALGVHEQALKFRSQRAEVLANNLANAETPNYKARDLEFSAVLAAQQPGREGRLRTKCDRLSGQLHLPQQQIQGPDDSPAGRLNHVS